MDWQLVASYFTVKSTDVFYSVCPFNSFEQMWGLSSLCPYFETKFANFPWSFLLYSELQIRGIIEDNSKVIFLISQQKHML